MSAVAEAGIVEIVGDIGAGKTRLWHEVRAADTDSPLAVMRAEPHEVDAPYLPVRRFIGAAAGIGGRDDAASAGTLLRAHVKRSAKELLPWLPLLADLMGATVASTAEVDALDPMFRPERLWACAAELVADDRRSPMG